MPLEISAEGNSAAFREAAARKIRIAVRMIEPNLIGPTSLQKTGALIYAQQFHFAPPLSR